MADELELRAERRPEAWSPGRRWLPAAAGLLLVAAVAVIDASLGSHSIVTAAIVVAPFVVALTGSVRQTAAVAVVAVAVAVLSGTWNHNYGSPDYLFSLFVVIAGAAFAVSGARSRARLTVDRERFRLLSAAARISDTAITMEQTVQRLGDLLVPALADICVIDVLRDDELQRLYVAASGPRAADIEAGLRRRAAAAGARPATMLSTMRAGHGTLLEHPTDERLREAAHDDDDLRFLRSLDGTSTVLVPLRARGRSIGAMALMTTAGSGRRYARADLEFAEVLSGRVALALDNAGLFSEVESLEAQQTAALGSLAEAVTVQNADGALVYANEAAAKALGFESAEHLLSTPPQQIVDAFDSYTEDGSPLRIEDVPGRRALRGETPDPLLVRVVHRATGMERWRVTKATAVLDRDGRPRLAVNVIEDVTEVKRAELTQRFLAQAGELLSSSLDYEETLAAVARLAVPELADWCGVSIPDERGYVRSVAVAHVDPGKVEFARDYNRRYPVRVDDQGGAAEVLRDGRSQVVNEIPDDLLRQAIPDPHQLEALRSLGMRAVMLVPMVAAGHVLGVISFVSAESGRTFSAADLSVAEELGRRAGTAVENARLYTERSQIAQTLQASLLPDALPEIPGFGLASLYRPAGEETFVGGDFYDVFAVGSGWMLVIGDVTGRGAEAAALTAQARHTLRTAAMLLGDPRAAVEELNRALAAKPEISLCTVAVLHLSEDDAAATVTVTCAGHPQPYLIRDGAARQIGRSGPVVGAWETSTWQPESVDVQPGDVIVLYTDGVIDTVGSDGRFGEDRLAAALAQSASAEDAVTHVRAALGAFERGVQADDTAVVAMQRLPEPVDVEQQTIGARSDGERRP